MPQNPARWLASHQHKRVAREICRNQIPAPAVSVLREWPGERASPSFAGGAGVPGGGGDPCRFGRRGAGCVVEHMAYRAADAGGGALFGDVLTAPGPQLALAAPAMRQGNSVARLRTVDRQAAEDLFNASYPRLAGWVRKLVDDDETAHEIASEAFTRLLARWSGLDNPQSYLYMIATNLVRDHWRKSGRERRAIRS